MSIDFNPLDPELRRDPFDAYARGRGLGIVVHEGLPMPLRSALVRKTSLFERTDDAPLPLHSSPVFRSFRSIPVRLEAA